jgi:hypothetical protein
MQSNPIVEKQQEEEQERRLKAAYRYPFNIVCVFQDSDNNDFPIIRDVNTYCKNNNLTFLARQYDIDTYGEDMTIKRLPAFHIYYKKYIDGTEYYDSNPIYKIQTLVWAYEDEMREKERKKLHRQEQWASFVETLQSIVSLDRFKKKPALDLDASLSHIRDDSTKNNKTTS